MHRGVTEVVTTQAMARVVTMWTVMWRNPGKEVTEAGSDGAHRVESRWDYRSVWGAGARPRGEVCFWPHLGR